MPVPNEIIVGPAEVYIAPVGTAFPAVTAERPAVLAAGWTLIGTAGSRNYSEDGVILRQNRTINPIRVLGSIAPRKQVISEQTFEVEFNVVDLSPEAIALGYGADVADIVESGGNTSFSIPTSPVPLTFAILVRVEGQSPLVDGGNTQWQIYQAVQGGSGEGTFSKTAAFAQGHLWSAIENSDGEFVDYVVEGISSS